MREHVAIWKKIETAETVARMLFKSSTDIQEQKSEARLVFSFVGSQGDCEFGFALDGRHSDVAYG